MTSKGSDQTAHMRRLVGAFAGCTYHIVGNLMSPLISVLRVVGWYQSFYSNFDRSFCKQTVETLIRRHILPRLIWSPLFAYVPQKETLGLMFFSQGFHLYHSGDKQGNFLTLSPFSRPTLTLYSIGYF